jgi:hypothetical protein
MADTKWLTTDLGGVDWPAIERAIQNAPRPARVKLTKLMFGLNHTNYLDNKYYKTSPICPCCLKDTETFQHILNCPSKSAHEIRTEARDTVQQTLEQIFTPSQMTAVIVSQAYDPPKAISSTIHQQILLVSKAQNSIGWHNFVLSWISTKWRLLYEKLYTPSKNPKPSVWSSKLISALWTYVHSIWKGRNQIAHGKTINEQTEKHLRESHLTVTCLYNDIIADPLLVLQHLCYLINRPLPALLQMSEDATNCWIATIEEAKRTQALIHKNSAQSARCLARFLGKENSEPSGEGQVTPYHEYTSFSHQNTPSKSTQNRANWQQQTTTLKNSEP